MAEFDEKLIGCVKEYPCLYNTKLSDFKVSIKKENAWSAVAKSMNYSGKQYISSNACACVRVRVCVCVCVCKRLCVIMYVAVSIVELVQKRWKNLRERYMVNACNSDLLVIRTVDNSRINRKLGPNYRVYQLSSTVHNFLPF